MPMNRRLRLLLLLPIFSLLNGLGLARSIYVNGVDISGAYNQNLSKVDVHINSQGDVFIRAPHYEVHEEDSYIPLKSYMKKQEDMVEHKEPAPLESAEQAMTREVPFMKQPSIVNPDKKNFKAEDMADIMKKPGKKAPDR